MAKKTIVHRRIMNRRKEPYPWDSWFKGVTANKEKQLNLVKGKDFDCSLHSMALQIRNKAARYSLQASVYTVGDTLDIVLRKADA